MALKDLVADRSKITEEMIENIITNYVRYDPGTYEIVLTPSGIVLSNDAKVLVVLLAIMGWQYVVDDVRTVATKPVDLEALTGISGGTLRPVLKKLKDAHLLAVLNGSYSVRIANLDAIRRAIRGEKTIAQSKRKPRKVDAAAEQAVAESRKSKDDDGSIAAPASRGRRKTGVPVRASLVRLLDAGFFVEARTLGHVVARLHEMAIIAKSTSLSGPIAELVREGKLVRKKIVEGAKEVWSYRAV